MKGTTKIFVRTGTGLERKITNASSQIIETDDPANDIQVVDLKTPDNSLIELYQLYVQAAKDALGVTEASQGRAEGGSLSGKALELLSQNTQGRLSTKQFEKNIAFANLYRLYFEFMVAFYDDPVPFRVETADKPQYGYFDKSKLIKQDDAGEWYYPDFDIYISADTGLPKDKNFIINTANQALQTGAIDPVDYWYIMDSTGFPNASFILERAKEKEQQAIAMQEQQAVMQQNQQAMAEGQQELKNQQEAQKLDMQREQHDQAIQQGQIQMEQSQQELEGNGIPSTDEIMAAFSKLSPKDQQRFINGKPEEQLAIIQKALGK